MKLRLITISALVFTGMAGAASADVYRWVDEHGEAHYTDRWVPGAQLVKSSKPHSFGSESDAAQQSSKKVAAAGAHASGEANEQVASRAVNQDVAKVREQQCKEAQERYTQAIQARRLYKSTKDGERDYMSDEEADAYRLKARNDVQEACGKPPAAQ